MKKILSILLICSIVFSNFTVLARENTFSDLKSTHWAYNDVMKMANKGAVTGYPDGTFRPGENVTRGEFCAMLAKAANLYVDSSIVGAHWSAPYVEAIKKATWTYESWYLQKDSDFDTFINRSEAALALQDVYLGYPVSHMSITNELNSYLKSKYNDYSNFGGFADAIYTVSTENLMNGYEDGCFHPEYKITRAEVCAILNRAFSNGEIDSSDNSDNVLNVQMDKNSTVAKNVAKLKKAIINNGQRASGGYGFKTTYGGAVTSLIYLYEDDTCTFSTEISTSDGEKMLIMLRLSEGEIPVISVFMNDDLTFVGNYSQPSKKLNIIKSPGGELEGILLQLIDGTYKTFDAFINIIAFSSSDFKNIKISNFGIDY